MDHRTNVDFKPLKPTQARVLKIRTNSYLLNVIVAQGTAVLELLSGEDQTLLVWGNPFLVLNLGFDIVDSVARFDVKGNGLTREGLDEAVS